MFKATSLLKSPSVFTVATSGATEANAVSMAFLPPGILFIFFVSTIEIFFGEEPAIFTGLTLWFLLYAAISIGRKGSLFTAIVWLPITLSSTLIFTLATVGGKGLAPTKLGLALVTSLARLAPYLLLVTIIGWAIYYFKEVKPGRRADLS